MRKLLFIVGIIVIYLAIGNVVTSYNLIPDDAIRIRVIANSNETRDQEIKENVSRELEGYFFSKLKSIKGADEANKIIAESIPEIEDLITSTLGNDNYILNHGMNYFPKKEYKGIVQEEGYYQSIVVTIGSGEGSNWWCILFPPLCLLEGTEMEDVEYRSLVADVLNKYF